MPHLFLQSQYCKSWYLKSSLQVSLAGEIGHQFKDHVINQASSDSQLAKHRAKFADSVNDLDGEDTLDREGPVGDSRGPIFLPNVANMKHNVSEKVAQVGIVAVKDWNERFKIYDFLQEAILLHPLEIWCILTNLWN